MIAFLCGTLLGLCIGWIFYLWEFLDKRRALLLARDANEGWREALELWVAESRWYRDALRAMGAQLPSEEELQAIMDDEIGDQPTS